MWDDNENDEAIVNFGNFEDPKKDDDFIQSMLDSFIIKEKKKEIIKKDDEVCCSIQKLPQETLIGIFTYLPIYTLFKLQFVCTLFNHIINKFLFKYRFNYIYKRNMKKYINTFWASITYSLEDLHSTNNITHIYGNNLTPRYMGGNPVDRSRLSLSKVIDGQRVYQEGKFEEAFKQLHCLFHDKVFIYILLNDFPHCDLFSTVVQMGMCNRGLDGLYNVGEFVNNYYTFPNIFGYILSQIAFALIDSRG